MGRAWKEGTISDGSTNGLHSNAGQNSMAEKCHSNDLAQQCKLKYRPQLLDLTEKKFNARL